MSTPYTDRLGFPLTAGETLARMHRQKRKGYYDDLGRWVRAAAAPKPRDGRMTKAVEDVIQSIKDGKK